MDIKYMGLYSYDVKDAMCYNFGELLYFHCTYITIWEIPTLKKKERISRISRIWKVTLPCRCNSLLFTKIIFRTLGIPKVLRQFHTVFLHDPTWLSSFSQGRNIFALWSESPYYQTALKVIIGRAIIRCTSMLNINFFSRLRYERVYSVNFLLFEFHSAIFV